MRRVKLAAENRDGLSGGDLFPNGKQAAAQVRIRTRILECGTSPPNLGPICVWFKGFPSRLRKN